MTPPLLAWFFPLWLVGQDCPEWSLGYLDREACDQGRQVAELRGYQTERCEVLAVTIETRLAEER